MKKIIWIPAARPLLYEELLRLFRPHARWENQAYPSKAEKQKFDEFCETFAKMIGAKSGAAVKHQIAYAVMQKFPDPA
jgi:hypothetical protein